MIVRTILIVKFQQCIVFKPGMRQLQAGAYLASKNCFCADVCIHVYVCVHVCVHVRACVYVRLRIFITSGIIWCNMDLI